MADRHGKGKNFSTRHGSGSQHDLHARAARHAEIEANLDAAVQWCLAKEVGVKAACNAGLVEHHQLSTLSLRLRAAKETHDGPATRPHDDARFVLLPEEEEELVVWAAVCGQQGTSVTNKEMSDTVLTLLRLRKVRNDSAEEDGRAEFPLSKASSPRGDRLASPKMASTSGK